MKLIIGTDHRGENFKKELIKRLSKDYEIVDASPDNYPTDDYPDFAFRVCKMLLEEDSPAYGILTCATGVGMCIAANKVKGIRCALVNSARVAKYARCDDDANVIALDSENMDPDFAVECIKVFASTPMNTEEKYHRRLKKVLDYENGEYNEL